MVQVVDPVAALSSPLWPLLVDPQTGERLVGGGAQFLGHYIERLDALLPA